MAQYGVGQPLPLLKVRRPALGSFSTHWRPLQRTLQHGTHMLVVGGMEKSMDPKNNQKNPLAWPQSHPQSHLSPDIAYLDRWLYLPTDGLYMKQSIRDSLTIRSPKAWDESGVKEFRAYEDLEFHLAVPRAFLTPVQVESMGYPVRDLRPHKLGTPWKHTITPRTESQADAMRALDRLVETGESGILEMGCGKGKTVMSLYFAAQRGLSTLIIVNSTSLLNQWRDEVATHLGKPCGLIRGDKMECLPVSIATIQTLASREIPEDVLNMYGTIIFDECHHLSAPTFNSVCPMFAGVRLGLTATRQREDGLEGLYLHHIGPVIYRDLTTELQPNVIFLRTGITMTSEERESIEVNEMVNISKLRGWLANQDLRNGLILNEILSARQEGRASLVLGHNIEHLTYLHSQIPDAGLYIGKMSLSKRDVVLKTQDVIFATTKLAAEGLDEPRLDTLFIITPFKSTNLLQQAMGRVLRIFEGKQDPLVVVFEDPIVSCINLTTALKNWLKQKGIRFKVESL